MTALPNPFCDGAGNDREVMPPSSAPPTNTALNSLLTEIESEYRFVLDVPAFMEALEEPRCS